MREIAHHLDSDLDNVSIITPDSITLRAWTIHPHRSNGDAVVHVQLVATLARRADRSLVASVEAESVAPVAENRLQAVIAAYRNAVSEALGQLVARLP